MTTKKKNNIDDIIREDKGEISHRIVNAAADDLDSGSREETSRELEKQKSERRETFYSDLIYTITHQRKPENEARLIWGDLLHHKKELSEKLKRNVGIRVAALDYFQNITKDLGDVKIIEDSEYIQTERLAVTDGLTNLFNHRFFHDTVEKLVRKKKGFTVFLFDIDDFKKYNDKYGHIAGDIVLREFGLIINDTIRENDLGFRYGGEEFAVIFSNTGKKNAPVCAERIRKQINNKIFPNDIYLSVSGGLAFFPEQAESRKQIIDLADKRLYKAKEAGKNRVIFE